MAKFGGVVLLSNGEYHIICPSSSSPPSIYSSSSSTLPSKSKCRPHIPRKDNVIHRIHDISQLVRICGIRVMHIHLLVLTPVQTNKPFPEKLCRFLHTGVRALIVWEIIFYAGIVQFFPEDIGLVEKEDDGCVGEPLGVADLVK